MPPMLNIPFVELMRGSAQDMLAGEGGLGKDEGHDILKLVAKAISTSRLIESGTSPDAATERLIKQPAIGEEIYRRIRRFNVHGTESPIPMFPNFFESGVGGMG